MPSGDGNRLPLGEASFRDLYRSYQHNAKLRSREFSLTQDEFRDLTKQNCVYCGILPSVQWQVEKKTNGYTVENCVPCCKQCNWGKNTQDTDVWLSWLDRVAKFRGTL